MAMVANMKVTVMVMVLMMKMGREWSKHYSPSFSEAWGPCQLWVGMAKGAFQVGLQTTCSELRMKLIQTKGNILQGKTPPYQEYL